MSGRTAAPAPAPATGSTATRSSSSSTPPTRARPVCRADDDSDERTILRDTRSERLLRILVETQGLLLADLSPEDRDYWRSQRQLLLRRATEMTGASAELRAEGVVLVLPPDGPWSKEATVNFPAATADAWVALTLLDAANVAGPGNHRRPERDHVGVCRRRCRGVRGPRAPR